MSTLDSETFWEKAAKTKMGAYLTDIETAFSMNAIKPSEGNIIVDIGTGAGKFSLLVSKSNVEIVSLDISLQGLKRLRSFDNQINVILADARYMPLVDRVLNAAFMIEVLDYIPELEMLLKEVWRVLGGKSSFVFTFGNSFSLKSKIRGLFGRHYMHSYYAVIRGLDVSGFEVKKEEGFNWLPFGRTSNNTFIPILARIEKFLGLREIPSLSPWVLINATKKG